MSSREIFGFLSVIPDKGSRDISTDIQTGNLAFRERARIGAFTVWNSGSAGLAASIVSFPWKNARLLDDNDPLIGHASILTGIASYPRDISTSVTNLSTFDYRKFRTTGTIASVPSTSIPRVIGAVGAREGNTGSTFDFLGGDSLVSLSDVPKTFTQIGIVYFHPTHTTTLTVNTSVGSSFVTFTGGNQIGDFPLLRPGCFNLLRIETGPDAGFYYVSHQDYSNNRIYLYNLDGTLFSAVATASGLASQVGPGRRALFNETSIIPLSVGQIQTSGRFNSSVRESFNVRIVFDKTGSDSTAGARQGSYYFTMRPWTHGDGILGGGACPDFSAPMDFYVGGLGTTFYNLNFWDGGTVGYSLDEVNQRVFWASTNALGQSGIYCWRWKTCESFRELSNHLGTQIHGSFISPSINLSGPSAVFSVDRGSDNITYFGINHVSGANGGLALIRPDLTTAQYTTSTGVPSSQVAAAAVDRSRNRNFTNISTTAASNTITTVGGTFTNADLGRVIRVNSGADTGTYRITVINSATSVTVTTPAGGAVTFTGSSSVTGNIGDRIYLFFNNNTTGAGRINYMESLSPGNFYNRTVTMTNGANLNIAAINGERMKVSIDQTNGNVYWLSNDTQQQINRYDVTSNTHTFRTIANIQSPAGGVGSITNPTLFTAIQVNPTFDEIWVGTDQGHVRLVLSDFTGSGFRRHFGSDTTTYANPSGFLRPDGSTSFGTNSRYVRNYIITSDSKVYATQAGFGGSFDRTTYSRASDTWSMVELVSISSSSFTSHDVIDSNGRGFFTNPGASSGSLRVGLPSYEIQYQWDSANSVWYPREIVQGVLPNKDTADSISPGCRAKPIHSGFENLIHNVQVRFTPQGGATPPNNEFLGRAGVSGSSRTDGSTTSGGANFGGSSFVSGDVGKLLRIESGADSGVYRIITFVNSTTITIQRINRTAFSASATAASLTYSIWDFGTPGSNAGPENVTFILADGFAKDNTQDLTNISYESYQFKTILYENTEAIKFCVPVAVGPAGSLEERAFQETFARAVPQYDAVLGAHRALPVSPTTNGDSLLDFFVDKTLNGLGGRANFNSSPVNSVWHGINADSSILGFHPIVDLGVDADIGYIILRATSTVSPAGMARTATSEGMIADLVNAPASGGVPANSSVIRLSGTANLSGTLNNTTLTLSSGDFLGPVAAGPFTNGSTTAGGLTFSASAGTFITSHVGMILRVTTGADIGSYRILTVAGDGSSCTVRNLNQTTLQWGASASSLSYEIRDGVRESDQICSPSLAVPTHRFLVERLLSTTSVQVRVGPNTGITNQNYQCVAPTWRQVKRLSHNTEAVPPDVRNNGTWMSLDGRERLNNADFKIYMDLTDLPAALRTGRYWKMVMTPRFNSVAASQFFNLVSWEFYNTSGNRIGVLRDQFSDAAIDNSDFLSQHVNRADFIQANNNAVGGAFNGLATLGGSSNDTITLAGGNKFLGFQVRTQFTDGNPIGGGNTFNSSSAAFTTADVGRFIRIQSGANSGNIYRIATRVSASQVTVANPSGSAVTFGSTETSIQFTLHEGFSGGGGANPDLINLGAPTGFDEFTIESMNDALTQIIVVEKFQNYTFSNVQWEIRRRALETTSSTTEAGRLARLVIPENTYPVQTGDIAHDSRGALRFFSEDVGAALQRNNGVIPGGSGAFTGTLFSQDDVGRLLSITTGVNVGFYRISAFSSSTSITLQNAYTGAAVSLTADAGPVSYRIFGERRFRLAKYVATVRS